MKLILDIIESLISKIKVQNFELINFYVNLVEAFLEITNSNTFEIFRYLQSIYSSYNNDSNYIIFPLVCSMMFDKSQIKRILREGFAGITVFRRI